MESSPSNVEPSCPLRGAWLPLRAQGRRGSVFSMTHSPQVSSNSMHKQIVSAGSLPPRSAGQGGGVMCVHMCTCVCAVCLACLWMG